MDFVGVLLCLYMRCMYVCMFIFFCLIFIFLIFFRYNFYNFSHFIIFIRIITSHFIFLLYFLYQQLQQEIVLLYSVVWSYTQNGRRVNNLGWKSGINFQGTYHTNLGKYFIVKIHTKFLFVWKSIVLILFDTQFRGIRFFPA